MSFRNWLLTGTSITLLAFAPMSVVHAQDAADPALVAAFQAFRADQSDANRQALTEACISAGFQSLDDCIAALSGVAPVDSAPPPAEQPAPPAEEPPPPPAEEPAPPVEQPAPPPAEEPAPPPPPVEEPAPPVEEPAPPPVEEPAPPVEEPAPPPEQPAPPPAAEEPAPEQPAPEQPAPPPPAAEEPAPAQPAAEQPADQGSDVLSRLAAAVDLYNEGVAELDAGNPAGQAKIDQARGEIDAICSAAGFTDTESCLAQFGLELSPLPPVAEEPAATPQEPAAEEPAAEEPIADMPNADEPVTPEATEPLPENVQPEEAAPILDSEKDATAPPADETPAQEQPAAPEEPVAPPPSDEAAQDELQAPPAEEQSATTEEGEPVADGAFDFGFATPDDVPPPAAPQGTPPDQQVEVVQKPSKDNPNFIFKIGINIYISNVESQRDRYYDRNRDEIYYEDLSRGRIRETIVRPDGTRIVTVYNRYGEVLKRTKITPDDREFYLFTYDPRQADRDDDDSFFLDVGRELPPLRLNIPARDYILDAGTADEDEVEFFLGQPPVEKVRRIYSIDEVKRSARLRDSVRRLEVGNLTFDTGKATISRNQVTSLSNVAKAMLALLDRNPAEIFLIEGHTDAVGSDVSNLVLSDQRAATVARILTDFYEIPPENLVTQGYGERYLKVKTEAAEPLNRRVTVKRITPLVTYQTASN